MFIGTYMCELVAIFVRYLLILSLIYLFIIIIIIFIINLKMLK